MPVAGPMPSAEATSADAPSCRPIWPGTKVPITDSPDGDRDEDQRPQNADGRAEDSQARVDLGGEQQPRADVQREAARQRRPRAGQQPVQAAVDGIAGVVAGLGAVAGSAAVAGGGGRDAEHDQRPAQPADQAAARGTDGDRGTATKMTLALMSTASK